MVNIANKLNANLGYILIGLGLLVLLAEVMKQPYAIVSFGPAKVQGISQPSAIRLFVGIVLLIFGIYVQYKRKRG